MGGGSAFICAFLVVVALQLHADHSVAHELSHELQGKVFLLRNFYRGDRLQYDSAGQPLGNPPTGSWTVDGALGISKVNISHNRLQIHSKRYFLSPTPAGYELLPSERELTIEVNVGSQAITVESVHALMNHVFLPPRIVPPISFLPTGSPASAHKQLQRRRAACRPISRRCSGLRPRCKRLRPSWMLQKYRPINLSSK